MTEVGAIAGAFLATPLGTEDVASLRGKPLPDVAREFEALLFAQMIGAMRKTVGDSGLLSASPERKTLDGYFDLELARQLVKSVDLGLARQLTRQVEGRQAAASAAAGVPGRPAAVATADAAPGDGALAAPLVARVSSGYGERLDPITGEPDFHAGIDLAAPRGTPVRAAADGTVVFSGVRGGAGNLVELEHADGTRTSYAHLDEIGVAPGERVAVGQVLGAVGTTGRTTGPHLHFAVHRGGVAVDPTPLLDRVTG